MIFTPTAIEGSYVVELARLEDERGFFARAFCAKEFTALGLDPRLVQSNVSFNHKRGTLRGLHYQGEPYQEAKLVRCTQGAIWDVVVDLRARSPSFKRWFGTELTAENRRALYVPAGCAHGFQTLTDNSEVLYLMSQFYEAEAARGVPWNDAAFAIAWPIDPPVMSPRDRSFKPFGT